MRISPKLLSDAVGSVRLVDARTGAASVKAVAHQGHDLNEGEPFAKLLNPRFSAAFRGDESPMSRRCFDQPSLADAFVKAYSRAGGFLEEITNTETSKLEALQCLPQIPYLAEIMGCAAMGEQK